MCSFSAYVLTFIYFSINNNCPPRFTCGFCTEVIMELPGATFSSSTKFAKAAYFPNILRTFAPVKLKKNQYLRYFAAVVGLLAVVRLVFPSVAGAAATERPAASQAPAEVVAEEPAEVAQPVTAVESVEPQAAAGRYNPIRGVVSYRQSFPDDQDTQIVAARKWGVRPVRNREDAEERKRELVYVNVSPYYHVDRLGSSIPYLVPRAALLLRDIGEAFYDSLYRKGVPMQQLIVSSVLRSMDDVARLQRFNSNATENSCHLYGTTFDICYNRYRPLEREVRNDTLKWILSEVLDDQRQLARCYVKHEVKQGCFHITVR